jgi:hypothetical protein
MLQGRGHFHAARHPAGGQNQRLIAQFGAGQAQGGRHRSGAENSQTHARAVQPGSLPAGYRGEEARRMFFLEKKNQKTFAHGTERRA